MLKEDISAILGRQKGTPTPPLTQQKAITLNKRLSDTLKIKDNGQELFNRQRRLDALQESLTLKITQPPIESMDKLHQIETDINRNIKKINEVQLKVDAKVVQEMDSLDYNEAKEDKEYDEQKIKQEVHRRQEDFINIAKSDNTQKELLWLMR